MKQFVLVALILIIGCAKEVIKPEAPVPEVPIFRVIEGIIEVVKPDTAVIEPVVPVVIASEVTIVDTIAVEELYLIPSADTTEVDTGAAYIRVDISMPSYAKRFWQNPLIVLVCVFSLIIVWKGYKEHKEKIKEKEIM